MFKTITLTKTNITYVIKFLILLALATGAPLLGFHSQWVTGPIVNAALILSVYLIGIRGALLIGILPSTIALSTGLLPAVLAPMVPFIIISNSILVLVMDYIVGTRHRLVQDQNVAVPRSYNYFIGLFTGAGLKYLFLFFTSSIVINLLLNSAVASKVASMMSWPQFFTAIIGGILSFGILKISTRL
ncbi:MAG: iron hydrogenase [Candidatus Falkowbacteria bacterium]